MVRDPTTLAPPGRVLGPLLGAAALEAVAWGLLWGGEALAPGWYGRSSLLMAVHTLALGVLALSLTGAGWQLVPVIAARPLAGRGQGAVTGALLIGAAGLVAGMGGATRLGHGGAALVIAALLGRSALVLPPLLRASGRRAARAWLLGAELSLWAGLGLGALLWLGRAGHPQIDPVAGIGRHASLLLGGWVLGWIVGTGSLLLPMFAIGREPSGVVLGLGCALWALGLVGGWPLVWGLGLAGGAAALGSALWSGARRGPALAQVGLGLVGLLGAWLGGALGLESEHVLTLALVLGVLPFLRGVALRIVPFLAWTHAYGQRLRGAPTAASLGPGHAAWVQGALSVGGGLALIIGRIAAQAAWVQLGLALLLLGALLQTGLLGLALGRAWLGHLRGAPLAGMEAP